MGMTEYTAIALVVVAALLIALLALRSARPPRAELKRPYQILDSLYRPKVKRNGAGKMP